MEPPTLTREEQNILQDLEKTGYFQPSDTEGKQNLKSQKTLIWGRNDSQQISPG